MATAKTRVRPFRPAKRHFAALLRAEREAGGPRAFARLIGVSTSTVRRWKAGRLSADGWKLTEHALGELGLRRREGKSDVAAFRELIELAQGRDVPESKRLRLGRSGDRARGGALTRGHQWVRGWNRLLSDDVIGLFRAWAGGVPKRFPIWQAAASVAQLGPAAGEKTYRTVEFQVRTAGGAPHARARDFVPDGTIATRKSETRGDVIAELARKLGDALTDEKTQTFLKSTTVFNYRMRTDLERRARESFLRRKRKEKWAKRKAAEQKPKPSRPKKKQRPKSKRKLKAKKTTRSRPRKR